MIWLFIVESNPQNFDCNVAKWGAWRCEGDEDLCTGKAFRYKCVGGNCRENSPCTNIPGNIIEDNCETVKHKCQAWWGKWGHWSKCSATCGYMERKRFRACKGVAIKNSISKTCRDPKYVNTLPIGQASTQSNACFLRRLCPRVHGGWNSWGPFTKCSVTCGVGQRRRKRMCNNPEPIGGGMICTGIDTDSTECDTKRQCPIHGNWCGWHGVDVCSKVCGGGSGRRLRICECPIPQYGGIDCQGTIEKYDICNINPCPYKLQLTTSESLILFEDLSSYIQSDQWLYSNSGQVPQIGDVIVLQCPKSIKSRRKVFDVQDRFPNKKSYWMFNNTKINDSEIYFTDDEFLVIRGLKRSCVGFYSFIYIRDKDEEPDIVCFFSVYISDDLIQIKKKNDLDLYCCAKDFDKFKKFLVMGKWESWWRFDPDEIGIKAGSKPENFIWKSDMAETAFYLTDHKIIEDVDEKVSGTFTCTVLNIPTTKPQRIFITYQIRVEILPEQSFWEKVGEFIKSQVLVISLIAGAAVLITLILLIRFCQEAKWHIMTGQFEPVKKYKMITPM